MAFPVEPQSTDNETPQDFERKVWFKAHDTRIKQIKIVN